MFVKADIWTVGRTENGMAVLLRLPSSARCVPVYVEPHEAQAVLAGISGVKENPPRFPEFLSAFTAASGSRPESMEILRGDIPGRYRAVVHFISEDSRFSLDADTADALAFASRIQCPIFLEDGIPEDDGIAVSLAETEMPFASQLARLQGELDRRVNEEDYERAATIRDRIKQIEDRMRLSKE